MRALRSLARLPLLLLGVLALLGTTLAGPAASAGERGDNVWTPIGPYGGQVRSIAFHPTRPGVLWVGTESNGVFRSGDGGATWTAMSRGLPTFLRSVNLLEVSTAGGSETVYADAFGVLYRSVDGGPWEPRIGNGGAPWEVTADPFREGVLWAGNRFGQGIERSDDGGATWRNVDPLAWIDDPSPMGFVFSPRHPSVLWAGLRSYRGGPHGVLRSRDGGATWEVVGAGLPRDEAVSFTSRLEIAPDTGVLFALVDWATADGTVRSAVYRSVDQGDTWTLSLPERSEVTAGAGGLVIAKIGRRSRDGGLTWEPLGISGIPGGVPNLLAAHPIARGRVYVAPSGHGVYRSNDSGSTWRESNQGLLAAPALDLAVDPLAPGTLYASLYGPGLFKSTRGGVRWERLLPASGSFRFSHFDELAAVASGGETTVTGLSIGPRRFLVRSEDAGATWTNLRNPGIRFLQSLAADPKNPRRLYAGGDDTSGACGARRSSDGGASWTCMPLGDVVEIVVDPRRTSTLWALGETVFRSTDQGRTWSAADAGLIQVRPVALAPAPSSSNVAYLGTLDPTAVYRTEDGGRTWTPAGDGLPPGGDHIALAVHPRDPSIVYAGMRYQGVFRSSDGGRTWRRLPGSPVDFFGALVIDAHDPRTIYAGTERRGFFAITLRR